VKSGAIEPSGNCAKLFAVNKEIEKRKINVLRSFILYDLKRFINFNLQQSKINKLKQHVTFVTHGEETALKTI
jgi:hypothetical protein